MTYTRRHFLQTMGQGAAALVITSLAGCEEIIITPKIAGKTLPFATPPEQWYYQSGQGVPPDQVPDTALEQWACPVLSTDGSTLSMLDAQTLQSLEDQTVSYWKTMRCVFGATHGGPLKLLTYNAIFEGVPLSAIFETLNIPEDTKRVRFFGEDEFKNNLPLPRVTTGDALPVILATKQNGQPLTPKHGAPVRLIVPEMCGYKNLKWLSSIELSTEDSPFGKYEAELFAEDKVGQTLASHIDVLGWLPLSSNLSAPSTQTGAELKGPDVLISGVSTSGAGAITSVQISVDDGQFKEVTLPNKQALLDTIPDNLKPLHEQTIQASQTWPAPGLWLPWTHQMSLAPGTHTITVRSGDSAGRRQNTDDQRPIFYSQTKATFDVT